MMIIFEKDDACLISIVLERQIESSPCHHESTDNLGAKDTSVDTAM